MALDPNPGNLLCPETGILNNKKLENGSRSRLNRENLSCHETGMNIQGLDEGSTSDIVSENVRCPETGVNNRKLDDGLPIEYLKSSLVPHFNYSSELYGKDLVSSETPMDWSGSELSSEPSKMDAYLF